MKDSDLITFKHESIGELRGFMKDGEPWFLAAQVCRCLGIKNSSETLTRIKERHVKFGDKGVGIAYTLFQTTGGKQKIGIVSENVLYELIFRSDKKKAFDFQQWVFGEVLPSLRKFGEYRMQGKLIRRSLTDGIKESGENERMHGHAFSTYSMLINKSLGLPPKVNRASVPAVILEKIAARENTVAALIAEGKQYGEIKTFLEGLDSIWAKETSGYTVKIPPISKE